MEKPVKRATSRVSPKTKNTAKTAHSARTPEEAILKLAQSGQLAEAGQKAIRASFRKGIAVTILEGDDIIRLHPDGSRTFVKKLSPNKGVNDNG
ncbi:MAG: hypothetical protein AVDCRST_MAG56-937 [uncultured Cytophagales bacterium]|uniref:Uncharacterized protein n=1 Tax=uncultured Cytophagales bacterium TaxID=158755 RepID=A0A6J4HSL2_9SPHI|nr:MAG: hypothetical protein AVDCRST_MAG56-937 [uncultured Cytophagales bacterium]